MQLRNGKVVDTAKDYVPKRRTVIFFPDVMLQSRGRTIHFDRQVSGIVAIWSLYTKKEIVNQLRREQQHTINTHQDKMCLILQWMNTGKAPKSQQLTEAMNRTDFNVERFRQRVVTQFRKRVISMSES